MLYYIRDNHTGFLMNKGKPYASRNKAGNAADRLDLKYGAIRYSVITKE